MRSHSISIQGTPLLLVLLFSFLPLSIAVAQSTTGLPTGCHLATASDVAAGGSSVIVGVTNICPNDQRAGINGDVGTAKAYLDSLPKRPLSQCAPPTTANITALNNGFAVCAAAFFKAYTAKYGNVYITSAFRNNAPGSAPNGTQSANQCAGGAPLSRHALGLAIDVNPASDAMYKTMWDFASQNPQFGVCFPYQDGSKSGYYDRPHMSLAGGSGREASLCAAQGVTKPCTAGASFVPNTPAPAGGSTPQSPTAPITKNGVSSCTTGYILYSGQCWPAPDEAYPAGPSGICPTGYTPTAFQNNDTGTAYTGCTPTNQIISQTPTCLAGFIRFNNQCIPVSTGQSYCQIGYVSANGQCYPTQCNGYSQYAVTSTNPITLIMCPQNQNTQQAQTSQTGGTQSSGGSTPATGQSTTGLGTSGQSTTGGGTASSCTPQYACQDGIVYFQTNLCAIQIYQKCPYGCSIDGTTCAPTSTSTASTSTQLSTSFIDRLNSLFHPTSPTSTSPSGGSIVGIILDSMSSGQTSASLNQDIRNATGQTAGTTVGSTAFPSISSITGGPNPLIVTQTFTSSDQPGQTATNSSYSSQQPTFFQNALLDLKTTLLSVLAYLHIFSQSK